MSVPDSRPAARSAPPELEVLRHAEETTGWLLQRTQRWPKSVRHTLTQRIEQRALDLVEDLIVARYQRSGRLDRLDGVNLSLTRMRFLLRLAKSSGACPKRTFEGSVRRLDTIGRMLHGWRQHLRSGEAAE